MTLSLLGKWKDRIQEIAATQKNPKCRLPLLPMSAIASALETQLIESDAAAATLVADLRTLPIRAIAVDTEYQFKKELVALKSGRYWGDIRAIKPLVASFAVWVDDKSSDGEGYILRYVLDLRQPGISDVLTQLLTLRVPFVFHNMKAELFTFWSLGIDPTIQIFYDSCVAAAAIHMGVFHRRARNSQSKSMDDESLSDHAIEAKREHLISLVGQCQHYGLHHPFASSKHVYQQRFLRLESNEWLAQDLVEYAAADAEFTLRLYVAQQVDIMRNGLTFHLYSVEFPFIPANARIEWNGVHVSKENLSKLRSACQRALEYYGTKLKEFGMGNPNSQPQFLKLMQSLELLHHFTKRTKKGGISADDDVLEALQDFHPTIWYFRNYRKMNILLRSEWLSGLLQGSDGRFHPEHRQLGAQTSRNTCKNPNLAGIGKVLRPMVTAPAERAIVELDFSQVEVAIAAAEFNDPLLILACNSSDVYAFMAQRFYSEVISEEEKALDTLAFKKCRNDLRAKMKVFVLAILYGMQAPAIAAKFGVSLHVAEKQRDKFLNMYPVTKARLEQEATAGVYRGYACTVTGLRRLIPDGAQIDGWCRNFLRNTPIQGSAATVFKRAVILLDHEFRGSDAWLILPIHDAVVIECPLGKIAKVSIRAQVLMELALREFYPVLNPKVDVNASKPWCWNKDGQADSLEKFLENPEFRLDAIPDETSNAS